MLKNTFNFVYVKYNYLFIYLFIYLSLTFRQQVISSDIIVFIFVLFCFHTECNTLNYIFCQETARKILNRKISSTGGWCLQSSVENSGKHKTDHKLVSELAQFLKGQWLLYPNTLHNRMKPSFSIKFYLYYISYSNILKFWKTTFFIF